MNDGNVVSSRPDREIRKKTITPGDFTNVPFEDSRCRITLSNVECSNKNGKCDIEPESRVFSSSFDGNVFIGDNDCFIDKDLELVLQQMCCGEVAEIRLLYRDSTGELVKEISCVIELRDVTEEQLISDWSSDRLFEAALHHKECGVQLVGQKRITDAFRRFNKSLKMLIAIEPIDPELIHADRVKEMIDLKVKLYNNLAHCQLQYNEYEAALELCNRALQHEPENMKALYRRCVARAGLGLCEEAWRDIQHALRVDPGDKAAQAKANQLRPTVDKINKEYNSVIKKMFS